MAKHGPSETQRVSNLKEEVKQTYLAGNRIIIPEIAKHHKVSDSYAYKLLEDLAKELGIERDDLLRFPKTNFTRFSLLSAPEKADVNKLMKDIHKDMTDISTLISEIDSLLDD